MMTHARAAYMDASVATADPARLLLMLCDRLVLDVQRGLAAQEIADHPEAHNQLVHAQEIVFELRSSLRIDAFEGGEQLAAIYDHVHQQLIQANVRKDTETTTHCLRLVNQIADMWHQVATELVPAA